MAFGTKGKHSAVGHQSPAVKVHMLCMSSMASQTHSQGRCSDLLHMALGVLDRSSQKEALTGEEGGVLVAAVSSAGPRLPQQLLPTSLSATFAAFLLAFCQPVGAGRVNPASTAGSPFQSLLISQLIRQGGPDAFYQGLSLLHCPTAQQFLVSACLL